MLDVCEVKLNLRYPESRQEDITDAFMRGYTGAVEIGNKAIEKLKAENADLRETLKRRNRQLETMTDMWAARGAENAKLRELAVGMYGMLEMLDKMLGNHDACETPRPLIFGEDKSFKDVMHELGELAIQTWNRRACDEPIPDQKPSDR